ncbi:MAG TPA: glycosyltransferase [Puia sp.]|jgi:cellulose synthase/poly-beta-1,6-N-acetylglucosamine synthase-like glycosyltransferase|nr:glycosyltransferase [Puia sp.]
MFPLYLFTIISCSVLAVYGALIAWYLRAWKSIPSFTPPASRNGRDGGPRTRISVIIPARNEEQNIVSCLYSLARQTYPKELYEVVVVDDHSTDGTANRVREYSASDSAGHASIHDTGAAPPLSIHYLSLADQPGPENGKAYKKWAISTGIEAAGGELIVTTDADCTAHPEWLSTIASFYENKGAKFIAAPVRIAGGRSSFLSIFQILDFITLQGITGAAVFSSFHSMCNGANLAYEKEAFYEVDGFKGIDAIPSGDDMLLMHKIYLKYPQRVFFLKHRFAIVTTKPETRWSGFLNQRIRWASKADSYDDKRIFWVLLLVYLVNLLFVALFIAAFWNSWWLWVLLLLLAVKTIVEYPFVRSVATFFQQQRLMPYFAFLQPFHILYTIVVGWLGKFGSYRWKDRKIS